MMKKRRFEAAGTEDEMEYSFAPMEGITGYIYRNAHHDFFSGADCYYTPFITPKKGKNFTTRELNDVLPEHNEGMKVIPQILSNQAEGFLLVAERLKEMGYEEVNLNLGCPSGTVVAKKKGAGFLACPEELDRFLDAVFEKAQVKISIKTRIGKESPEEFRRLLTIFNKYPLEKLIIHPRVQTDFYKNEPNLEVFGQALSESKNPVCYNGDLFDMDKIGALCEKFPQVESVMLGRGLLVNPALLEGTEAVDKKRFMDFEERLVNDYLEVLSGERDVLFKMKELWFYRGKLYQDQENCLKKIRKAQRLSEYRAAVRALVMECEPKRPEHYGF